LSLILANPIQKQKAAWIKENEALRFSSGISLSESERHAEEKLNAIRDEIITPIHSKSKKKRMNPTIHNFFEMVDEVKQSKLHQVMTKMPKGGHHHLHLTAACHIDFLMELMNEDIVHFSEKHGEFRVYFDGDEKVPGFVRVRDIKEFYKSTADFKNYI
jgi:hypothetical protein